MSTKLNPLTTQDVNTFLRRNCLGCKHYQGNVGCIVDCDASLVTGKQDIIEWKRHQGNDAEKWTCATKKDKNTLL